MTSLAFDRSVLEESLARLSYWKQLVFSLLICERLYPNYGKFAEETGEGNVSIIRSAIDAAWIYVATAEYEADWNELALRCQDAAPNTEQFDSLYVASASDAASAAVMAMSFIESRNMNCVVETAVLALNSVNRFVREREAIDPQDSNIGSTHFLVQLELERQNGDVDVLQEVDQASGRFIMSSIRRWIQYGRGSLDSTCRRH